MSRESEKIHDDMNESDGFLRKLTDQLNTELQDIQVSDDLIQRTLDLAKKQEIVSEKKINDTDIENDNVFTGDNVVDVNSYLKKKHWWKKSMVSVAAACLVLVAGMGVFMMRGSSKMMESSDKHMLNTDKMTSQKPLATSETASEDKICYETVDSKSEERFTSKDDVSMDSYPGSSQTMQNAMGIEENNKAVMPKEELEQTNIDCAIIQAVADGCATEDITILDQTDEAKTAQVLLLLESQEVKLRDGGMSEKKSSIADYNMIVSMDDESAVLYQIYKDGTMKVSLFQQVADNQPIYYQINSAKVLQELEELLNP